ncbi:MAG: cadherin-like domain-containing protein, partial [Actinobacteria bacterium]|nr:cadherin-like domain-containing protein [Actinomycetota bacterium]
VAGCISADGSSQAGTGTCQTLATLATPFSVTLGSDDRFLYVNDFGSGSPKRIHVLSRDTSTGALSEIQCLAEAPSVPVGCTAAREVGGSQTLVLSPDGLHAYDGDASIHRALSVLDRDPVTGLLAQKAGVTGCLSDNGMDNAGASTCQVARELGYGLAISPDGHTLYVAAGEDSPATAGGVAILHVSDDGTVSQLPGAAGCISDTGRDNNTGAPTCTAGRGLTESYGLTVSPDGRTLYLADDSRDGGLAVFSLDPSTGEATQLPGLAGCIDADGESNGTPGQCTQAPATTNDWIPAVSPDGRSVYLAAYGDQAVTSFARETGPTCTASTASTAYHTPVSVTLACTDTDGDPLTTSILSPPAHGTLGAISNGTVTYTPAAGYTGPDSFTFGTTDTINASAAATATITVGAPPAPTTGPSQGTQPPAPTARTAAHITKLTQSHRRWHEGRHGGTTFSFTLNQAAQVIFTFTEKNHRRPLGRLTVAGRPGRNKIAFNGVINRHAKLKPGTYTVTIATGATTSQRLTFTIIK